MRDPIESELMIHCPNDMQAFAEASQTSSFGCMAEAKQQPEGEGHQRAIRTQDSYLGALRSI